MRSQKDIIDKLKTSLDVDVKERSQMTFQDCYQRNKREFDSLGLKPERLKEFMEFLKERLSNITVISERGVIKKANMYGQVKNKQELLEIIQRHPEGIRINDDLRSCMSNAETVLDQMVRNYEIRVVILSGQPHYASMKVEKEDRDFGLIVESLIEGSNQNPPKVYGVKEYLDLCRAQIIEKRATHLNQNSNAKEASGIDKSRFNNLVPNYGEWKKQWADEAKNKNARP